MNHPLPEFIIAIPARWASTRLPGKPLRPLGDASLVVQVARRAVASGASRVVVATDDTRIAEAIGVMGKTISVCMTSPGHVSGSDRLAECATTLAWPDDAIVVNLQGDEPFAPVAGIHAVVQALADDQAPMATLCAPIHDTMELFDPNVVKVVTSRKGRALYFSRAPLPWARDEFADNHDQLPANLPFLRHIGIYAYRAGFLRQYAKLPNGLLERGESLEQLRALEHGFAIAVRETPAPFPPGIDTPADLARAQAWLQAHSTAQ